MIIIRTIMNVLPGYTGLSALYGESCINPEFKKGVEHALYIICDSINNVAAGIDDRVHDGWNYSYSSGHSHRCNTDPDHSGSKTSVTILDLA